MFEELLQFGDLMKIKVVPTRLDEEALKALRSNIESTITDADAIEVLPDGIIISSDHEVVEKLSRMFGVSKILLEKKVIEGPKGLPIGLSGRALMMFSGGFDSPVASWMMWMSGFSLDFIHFNLTGPVQTYHMGLVLKTLYDRWGFSDSSRLYIVDFREVSRGIIELVDRRYKQIVLKRAMYKVSEDLAMRNGIELLATGESVGQVSSQTLHSLKIIEDSLRKCKVLRPLAGLDKEEIISLSREKIGIYDLSKNVGEYCALVAGRVVTRPRPQKTINEENKIKDLIEDAMSKVTEYRVRDFDPKGLLPYENLEIDFIPHGSVLVDARSNPRKDVPGSVRFEELDVETVRDKIVVVFCEDGIISREIALELREQGVMAYSLKGGVKGLKGGICPVI